MQAPPPGRQKGEQPTPCGLRMLHIHACFLSSKSSTSASPGAFHKCRPLTSNSLDGRQKSTTALSIHYLSLKHKSTLLLLISRELTGSSGLHPASVPGQGACKQVHPDTTPTQPRMQRLLKARQLPGKTCANSIFHLHIIFWLKAENIFARSQCL